MLCVFSSDNPMGTDTKADAASAAELVKGFATKWKRNADVGGVREEEQTLLTDILDEHKKILIDAELENLVQQPLSAFGINAARCVAISCLSEMTVWQWLQRLRACYIYYSTPYASRERVSQLTAYFRNV